MKRLASAFCILLILGLYNWFAEKFVIDFCSEIYDILEVCSSQIKEEKYSQAESTVSNLYNLWEETDDILSVFIGDSTVVEPRKSIVSILLSLQDENYEECLINIRECQGYIHDIRENNSTNLSNIL